MSDNEPKDNKDILAPTDLESVHAKAQYDLENQLDDEPDEKPKDEPADKPEEKPDDEAGEDDKKVVDNEPKSDKPDAKPVSEEIEDEADTLSSIQQKIPKIKVKDSDGKEHEFASTDDIPDDFEPDTYKSFAVATAKLAQRELDVRNEYEKALADKETKERNARIEKIKEQWDLEIATLKKNGEIPEKDSDAKETIDGVYALIAEEMNSGRTINSFTQAYEIYAYRKSKEEKSKEREELAGEKKRRGAMVMPGGSASPTGNKRGKVIEGPPPGVSLDQIHEKVLGSL